MMSDVLENSPGKIPPAKRVSPFLKWPAALLSYIFHPIFIPLYVIWFMVYVHPSLFSGYAPGEKLQAIFIVLQDLVFYPLFAVVLLKALKFIDSIFLHTKKDRIIPYMACGIFFFWGYTVFKSLAYPAIVPSFVLGIFLASSGALLANIYFKISMHAVGMGGFIGVFLVIAQTNSMLMTWPLSIAFLVAGLVCTARLIISDHSQKDIYTGLFVGLISQFVGAMVVM